MKRISKTVSKPKSVSKDDFIRKQKRKESYKRNNCKKRTPKQQFPKILYGSPEYLDPRNMTTAPYYDPYECHIHLWKNGTIPCAQNPINKFFVPQQHMKEFTGSYCSICHKTRNLFSMRSSLMTTVECKNTKTQNLMDAMRDYVVDESIKLDNYDGNNHNYVIKKRKYEPNVDIRTVETDEELFIVGTLCKFLVGEYMNKINKSGKIVLETEKEKLDRYLLIEDDDGLRHKINTNFVFPFYNNIKNEKFSPVKMPPKRVHLRKDICLLNINGTIRIWWTKKNVAWTQKWTNYLNWRRFQVYLKKYLPEEVVYFQSFKDSELYNHEDQSKLKMFHDWSDGNKIDYNQFNGSNKPTCFMPNNYIDNQLSYYKIVDDEEDIRTEMKRLKISSSSSLEDIQKKMKRLKISSIEEQRRKIIILN